MNKLNVTPFSIEQITLFEKFDCINAYIIGNKEFSLRYVNSFSVDDIKSIVTNKKVYVDMNKIIHNEHIVKVEEFLTAINTYIDGVIFSDMAIYQIIKENGYDVELIYSTETTATNKYFTNFAADFGIGCIDIAREVNLNEASEINKDKQSKVSFYIHGHIYMYQSLRKLVTNYKEKFECDIDTTTNFLFDEERELYYPIVENEQGTHVMSGSDLSSLPFMQKIIEVGFDYLKIDGFLYTENEYALIVELYCKAIKNLDINYQMELEKNINKKFSPGFMFKRTIY